MKKIWKSIILIMSLLILGCGNNNSNDIEKGSELVAESIDPLEVMSIPTNAFQDYRYFYYGDVSMLNKPNLSKASSKIEYYTSESKVKQYIDMLVDHGFTLVSTYKNRDLISFALTYDAFGDDVDTVYSIYDEVDCHLVFWTSDGDKYYLYYVNDLVMCDMGIRQDGETVELALQGESAATGLYRLGDGSYQSDDGRLTASVGSAMVIRDGEVLTADARYEVEKNKEGIWIEGYSEDEGMYILTKAGDFNPGDILQTKDVERRYKDYKTDEKYNIKNYNWDVPLFMMAYNDIWGGPKLSSSDFESLTIRCMYRDDSEAVYYIYAKLIDSQPSEIEALCAVSLVLEEENDKEVENGYTKDDEIVMKAGETIQLTDTRHKFGSDYHVYEWEIEEGEKLVDIEFEGSKCYVTALKKGEAVVASKYSYTEEGEDVLTGNKRVKYKVKTERFTITIE